METRPNYDSEKEFGFKGNPDFIDPETKDQEAFDLAKVQAEQRIEMAEHELQRAKDSLKKSESDPLVDPKAARESVDMRTKELENAKKAYQELLLKNPSNPETSH